MQLIRLHQQRHELVIVCHQSLTETLLLNQTASKLTEGADKRQCFLHRLPSICRMQLVHVCKQGVRGVSEGFQRGVRGLPKGCQRGVREVSEGCQRVPEGCQKGIREVSDGCQLTSAPPSVMRLLDRSKEVRNLFFCKASDICSIIALHLL